MESKTERSMPSTASNGAIENLLTLHGYGRVWSPDGRCWVVYRLSDPANTFVMGESNTLEEWVFTLDWYDNKLPIPAPTTHGQASAFFSPVYKK